MLERLRFGTGFSGTYKIHRRPTTDLAANEHRKNYHNTNNHTTIGISVLFLDDTTHTFHVEKRAKGADLLDRVFKHLEIIERDYFGLQFVHQTDDVVRWLDPNKAIRKQWNSTHTDGHDVPFKFSVKFYVTDPSRLNEEYTRYHFYLQIKRDIFHGKLPCSINTACLLASYTVQSELGDYNPLENTPGYLKSMQLLPEQNDETEHRITELHKLHRGQLPADAEYNYLEHAKKLYMYGVDLHKAVDSTGKEIELGVTSLGLVVFVNGTRINLFSWSKMVKISFKRKEFFLQLRREPTENYDTLLGFSMGSHKNAKALWKSCVEHHSFFRLERPYRATPTRFLPLSLGSKFYYSGRTELQTVQESRQRTGVQMPKLFTRSPTKRRTTSTVVTASSPAPVKSNGTASDVNGSKITSTSTTSVPAKVYRSVAHDNKITSKDANTLPRKAWEQQSDEERELFEQFRKAFQQQKIQPPTSLPLCNRDNNQLPTTTTAETTITDNQQNLITVRLIADEQGRFGFNVRGGIDLNIPVQVSRVAPHTPAGRSRLQISEGDHVIKINGRDVTGLMHDQVVSLIRESKEFRAGELVLTIRPASMIDGDQNGLCLMKNKNRSDGTTNDGGALDGIQLSGKQLFHQSIDKLRDGLASGTILMQYERLYRKNPELAISDAKNSDNLMKNRYRDISPYDCTRVVLLNSNNGDYINANYVNIEIPNDCENGRINRYIATQGPLSNTTVDFWRMVQQESAHLIVMLTTVMERGRPKCHQYWPLAGGDAMQLTETFSVRCLNEMADSTGSFVFREMQLCDKTTGENRIVQHMQYLAWPDHGVPSDPQLFLEFTERVRATRKITTSITTNTTNTSAATATLLQEIDQSLQQIREKNENVIGQHVTSHPQDVDKINTKNSVNGDAAIANDNDLHDKLLGEMETALMSSDGESPEEIILPPATSIHQYISAGNPPIIVHCSAGIGRTGVLILMDTALSLMNAGNAPIYPLDIVLQMRNQRACMVQNVSQFRFVCECICAAYTKLKPSESTTNNTISTDEGK